jgi:AcrR family transcriptional regulator
MTASTPPAPRRRPKQRRSQEIVAAILEAGRRLLGEEGPGALTTNRIAERAGVSIGSVYRYFPNKAAVVAAICEDETRQEASQLADATWPFETLSLEEALERLVDFQVERHRRLIEMGGDFYRDSHRAYSLARAVGLGRVEGRIRAVLARHADRVRVRDLDQGAYLVVRGVSAILRATVDERPEKLAEPAFRRELIDLMVRYVSGGEQVPD